MIKINIFYRVCLNKKHAASLSDSCYSSHVFIHYEFHPMRTLQMPRPDDWHVHFRDEDILQHTVPATAAHFSRALVMPNLRPALTTINALKDYHQRIMMALPNNSTFTPFLTFYLNETVSPNELEEAKQFPYILGAKLYPAGATTHSDEGTRSIKNIYPLLDIMQEQGLVLQIHGEATHGDIFARESLFIQDQLTPLVRDFPALRIVLEHISTRTAIDFVTAAPDTVAATITPHHLMYHRNHLLVGGIKPHYYCLPILKSEDDQRALQQVATSGHHKFFAGTDSAPHPRSQKENACGCAGIYSAPYAVAMYAELFDSLGKLAQLNDFMSRFGADFYQLPINKQQIELIHQKQHIPETLPLGQEQVVPAGAGSTLQWSVHAAD